jgi:hypothetical protein
MTRACNADRDLQHRVGNLPLSQTRLYRPRPADGSGPIFSLYLEMATEEDKKMAENWKDDADGILIFVRRYRLFPNPHLC